MSEQTRDFECWLNNVPALRQYAASDSHMLSVQAASIEHGKLGCVYVVTITALSILLVREGNFQVLVILK